MRVVTLEEHFCGPFAHPEVWFPAEIRPADYLTDFLEALPVSKHDRDKIAHGNADQLLRLT